MSRRPPNPAAERAAQNQQTIKSLLKLEANKVCADCKRNKHPRWASWNLGVFVCIRCSGIHRGMGTHISRVKSVDLDAWTDEQLQSILSWGNARANKYWEAKLAVGHAPSEAKIENFIRTKYELKRWVMDGGIPDPATLDADGDDDIPLSIVKEKQHIDRKESIRKASVGQSAAPARIAQPQPDLIGGDPIPQRAGTAGPTTGRVPPKSDPAPPKTSNNAKDSLLGLDFLGETPAAPPRPASTTGTAAGGAQSRPDLKQSILSLYATAPRPQAPQQQPSHASTGSFGGMQAPAYSQPQASSGSGLNDAFSSLSFGAPAAQKSPPPQRDAFAGLGSPAQSSSSAFSGLGGGSFFDSKPAAAAPSHQQKQSFGGLGGLGGFGTPTPTASAPKPAPQPAVSSSSGLGDLFDFSTPAQPAAAPQPAQPAPAPAAASSSVFNLSATQAKPAQPTISPAATTTTNAMGGMGGSAWSNSDIWGNNAWGASDPNPPAKSPAATKPAVAASNEFGWGSSSNSFANQSIVPGASGGFSTGPKVTADEEFGTWTSSTTAGTGSGTTGGGAAKPAAGFGQNEDLFSNVWQ